MEFKKAEDRIKQAVNKDLISVAKSFINNGFKIYVVGGFVRDILLNRDISKGEYDLATNATPSQVKKIFKRIFPTGIKHGTVTLVDSDNVYEITTFRSDGKYSDGRRPDKVKFAKTIDEDLSRRDFSINGFAFDLDKFKLIDNYQGLEDLNKKKLITIGDPDKRFQEDGLRLVRAIRFACVLNFKIETGTYRSIKKNLYMLDKIAAERIKDEFVKIILAEKPSEGIELLRKTEILRKIFPELLTCYGVEQNRFHKYDVYYHLLYTLNATPPGHLVVRLAALFHDISKPFTKSIRKNEDDASFYNHEVVGSIVARKVLKRMRFSNEIINKVEKLVRLHMFYYTEEWTDSAVRRLLRKTGVDMLDDLFMLREADRIGNGMKTEKSKHLEMLRTRIQKVIEEENAFSIRHLNINGHDIMKIRNIKPSPLVGDILNHLLERVIEDPSLNEYNQLKKIVKEYKK